MSEHIIIASKGNAHRFATRTVTAFDFINRYDFTVYADATNGAFTLVLPNWIEGKNYRVVKTDSSANIVTVAGFNTDLINGLASIPLGTQGQCLEIQGGPAKTWYAVGGYTGTAATEAPALVTATTAGDTTGVIPEGVRNVLVTSSASTKIVTLPAPVPFRKLTIIVGANGFKLQSSAPATVAINGGTGASAVSAVGANVRLEYTCVDTTHWTATSISTVGATTAAAVAA